ncbi:MAG: RHS repeat-associated core domain-containing protein, partial [Bacteroidota bacterium]
FSAGLAGLAPTGGDNPTAPSAYLNYILFDTNYARVAAGAVQVPQAAGFEEPQRGNGYTNNNLLKFDRAISVSQTGYLYIWVSNESENTEVWFDDLNVIHQKTLVAEATDYGVWGDVMREQKWEDLEGKYRYGYQGKYAEKDEETGWNHFQLREYDAVIGRWTSKDPKGQYYSPYVAMSGDPVNQFDKDGGIGINLNGIISYINQMTQFFKVGRFEESATAHLKGVPYSAQIAFQEWELSSAWDYMRKNVAKNKATDGAGDDCLTQVCNATKLIYSNTNLNLGKAITMNLQGNKEGNNMNKTMQHLIDIGKGAQQITVERANGTYGDIGSTLVDATTQGSISVWGLSFNRAYHSLMVFVDKRGSEPVLYIADQWHFDDQRFESVNGFNWHLDSHRYNFQYPGNATSIFTQYKH